MIQQIFAYILYKDDILDDTALELVSAAKKINPDASIHAIVAGSGTNLNKVCTELKLSFNEVWKLDDDSLSYPNSEIIREVLVRIIPENSIILLPHEHFGMELSPGLSIRLGTGYLSDVVDFEGIDGNMLNAVREEFGGQVSTRVALNLDSGAVITIRPGTFKPMEDSTFQGEIIDKTKEALKESLPSPGRRFIDLVEAEVGDVDITKSDVLVSVGRGIEDEDNLEIIWDLAEAMGADVSCSRPIVDAKWLEKSRQVGTSGQTVKPKVYMALGISGSFQHMGGIKGAPFIIAVNKNSKAPIFQMADVGVVDDILDFIPELTDKINDMK